MKSLLRALATHAALCALAGVGTGVSAQPAASPDECAQKYKEVADAAIKLPYWEFDQTDKGWRQLGNCIPEQSRLLGRYIKRQEAELRGVRWHLAQTLAMEGRNAAAIDQALLSVNPDEAVQHPRFSWNSYALATVAYLRQDRAAFDVQYEIHRRAVEAHAENRTNLKVLTGLAHCFDKPYEEAYGKCRPKD